MSANLRSRYAVKVESAVREESMELEGKGELNIGVVGQAECRLPGERQFRGGVGMEGSCPSCVPVVDRKFSEEIRDEMVLWTTRGRSFLGATW